MKIDADSGSDVVHKIDVVNKRSRRIYKISIDFRDRNKEKPL